MAKKKKKGERQKDNISQLKLSEMTEVNLAVNMFHSSLKKKTWDMDFMVVLIQYVTSLNGNHLPKWTMNAPEFDA